MPRQSPASWATTVWASRCLISRGKRREFSQNTVDSLNTVQYNKLNSVQGGAYGQ